MALVGEGHRKILRAVSADVMSARGGFLRLRILIYNFSNPEPRRFFFMLRVLPPR